MERKLSLKSCVAFYKVIRNSGAHHASCEDFLSFENVFRVEHKQTNIHAAAMFPGLTSSNDGIIGMGHEAHKLY